MDRLGLGNANRQVEEGRALRVATQDLGSADFDYGKHWS